MAPKKESNDLRDYPDAALLHPSKYLSATDLRGREATVKIRKIEPRHMLETAHGKELKPLVKFEQSDKGWLMGVTSSLVIQDLYGKDPREWIGKSITLYPTTCRGVAGDMVDCVRVKKEIPQLKQSTKKQEPPAEPTRMKDAAYQFGEPQPEDDGAFSDDAMGFGKSE